LHLDFKRVYDDKKVHKSFFSSRRRIKSVAINVDEVAPHQLEKVLIYIGRHVIELKHQKSPLSVKVPSRPNSDTAKNLKNSLETTAKIADTKTINETTDRTAISQPTLEESFSC
jgi:hypothetical protein